MVDNRVISLDVQSKLLAALRELVEIVLAGLDAVLGLQEMGVTLRQCWQVWFQPGVDPHDDIGVERQLGLGRGCHC